jgi:hypothetical protein
MRSVIAIIVATIAISFSDWLFFGVIFHDRYMRTPEVWRSTSESRKIAWSMVMALIGTAAFVFLAHTIGVHDLSRALLIAALVWAAASLPQTVTNTIYVKYSSELAVPHAAGWLARLIIAAVVYVLIVG